MSEKLNQCCERLKAEIKTAESSIEQASHHLASATEQGVDALEVRLNETVAKCDEKREYATAAAGRLKQFIEEKKSDALTKLEDWKTDREISKIEKHADRLEQQAVDAVVVAAYALLEAEVAIVEALRARRLAIDVAG